MPPLPPEVTNTDTISANRIVVQGTEGQSLTITCISKGGSSKPTVEWYKGSTVSSPLSSTSSEQVSGGGYIVTIQHTFTPVRTDDRQTYICQSSYSTEPRLADTTFVELYLQRKSLKFTNW